MDGIYILKTIGEFRVSYSNLYINLFGSFDDESLNYIIDPIVVEKMFGKALVFTDINDAVDYAVNLSRSYEETDDGILLIDSCENLYFEDIVNGNSGS